MVTVTTISVPSASRHGAYDWFQFDSDQFDDAKRVALTAGRGEPYALIKTCSMTEDYELGVQSGSSGDCAQDIGAKYPMVK